MIAKKRVERSSAAKIMAKRQRQTELSLTPSVDAVEVIRPSPTPAGLTRRPSAPQLSPLYIPTGFSRAQVPPPPIASVPRTTQPDQCMRAETYPLLGSVAYIKGIPARPDIFHKYIALLQQEVRSNMPQYSPATWQEVRDSIAETSSSHPDVRDYRCEMCAMLVLDVPQNRRTKARFDKADDIAEVDLEWDHYILRPAVDAPIDAFGTQSTPLASIVGDREVTVLQTYWLRTEPEPEDKVYLLYELTAGRGVKMNWMDGPLSL